jgi:hypothetical protein
MSLLCADGAVWGQAAPGKELIALPPWACGPVLNHSSWRGDWGLSSLEGPMRQRRKVVRLKRKLLLGPPKRAPAASPSPTTQNDESELVRDAALDLSVSVGGRTNRRVSRSSFVTDDSLPERTCAVSRLLLISSTLRSPLNQCPPSPFSRMHFSLPCVSFTTPVFCCVCARVVL